jgi:hypothetical protein
MQVFSFFQLQLLVYAYSNYSTNQDIIYIARKSGFVLTFRWLIEMYKWLMEMEIIEKWSEGQGPTRGGLALKLKNTSTRI